MTHQRATSSQRLERLLSLLRDHPSFSELPSKIRRAKTKIVKAGGEGRDREGKAAEGGTRGARARWSERERCERGWEKRARGGGKIVKAEEGEEKGRTRRDGEKEREGEIKVRCRTQPSNERLTTPLPPPLSLLLPGPHL